MDTREGGVVAWLVKHGFPGHMPFWMLAWIVRLLVVSFHLEAQTQHCSICREQFKKILEAMPIEWREIRTRLDACTLVYKQHILVRTRLKQPDPTGGFASGADWLARYRRDPLSNHRFLRACWDDWFCKGFCIPKSSEVEGLQRCKRIWRELRVKACLFEIMARTVEDENSRDEGDEIGKDVCLFGNHTNSGPKVAMAMVYRLHAILLFRYFGSYDASVVSQKPPNNASMRYLKALFSMLKRLAPIMPPPWLSGYSRSEIRNLPSSAKMRLFWLRYYPVIATHAEVVAGPDMGASVTYSSLEEHDEAINPTGCRA